MENRTNLGKYASIEKIIFVKGKNIRIDFNNTLKSRVTACFEGTDIAVGDFFESEYVNVAWKGRVF